MIKKSLKEKNMTDHLSMFVHVNEHVFFFLIFGYIIYNALDKFLTLT